MTSEFKFTGSGGFRTARPGTEIIFGANEEYSSSHSPLKLLCITGVPCVFLFKPCIQGTLGKTFCLGDVRLNLTESV